MYCVTKSQTFSNGINENLNIELKELNVAIIGMYRPPGASKKHTSESFQNIDNFLMSTKMSNVVVAGDVNWPKDIVLWTKKVTNDNRYDMKPTILGPTGDDDEDDNESQGRRQQAQIIFNITSSFNLSQFVDKPTNTKKYS